MLSLLRNKLSAYLQRTFEGNSLKRYCRITLNKANYRYTYVPGAPSASIAIDTIYVPGTLTRYGGEPDLEADKISVSNLPSCIWLFGDAGSGKSTFLKYLLLRACRTVLAAGDGQVPVIVELRLLSPPADITPETSATWFLSVLRSQVAEAAGLGMDSLFDSSMTGRGLLVLLDGLDAVPQSSFQLIARGINEACKMLAAGSANTRIIMTSRFMFDQEVRDRFDCFSDLLYLRVFSQEDVYEFLRRWPFRANPQEAITRIFSSLADRPSLAEICANPLALSMYVSSYDVEGSAPAATLTDFYSQLTDELLKNRRRHLGSPAPSADSQERERILGRMALGNFTDVSSARNSISWPLAIRMTRDIYQLPDDEGAETALRQLAADTGLIVEDHSSESLRFIHLSFCEFFAAKQLAQAGDAEWRDLLDAYSSPPTGELTLNPLSEVIPFALRLSPPTQLTPRLTAVFSVGDSELVYRSLLETRPYDNPLWRKYINEETERILSVRSQQWDFNWLRNLHSLSLMLDDEASWRESIGELPTLSLNRLMVDIIKSRHGRLEEVFEAYAKIDPRAAFQLADRCGIDLISAKPRLVVHSLANGPFFQSFMERVRSEQDDAVGWAFMLSEAALLNTSVARWLSIEPANTLDSPLIRRLVRPYNRWHFTRAAKGTLDSVSMSKSLLTQALGIATSVYRPGMWQGRVFPLTRMTVSTVAPGGLLFSRFCWLPSTRRGAYFVGTIFNAAWVAAVFGL